MDQMQIEEWPQLPVRGHQTRWHMIGLGDALEGVQPKLPTDACFVGISTLCYAQYLRAYLWGVVVYFKQSVGIHMIISRVKKAAAA